MHKGLITLYFTIILLGSLITIPQETSADKFENYVVGTTESTTSCYPDILTLSNGSIHVSYFNNTGTPTPTIYYKYSNNGGRSFFTKTVATLSSSATTSKPVIAADYLQNIFVAYHDEYATRKLHVAKLAKNADNFQDIDISSALDGKDSFLADIGIVAAYNFVGVVYIYSSSYKYVRMVYSKDNGNSWTGCQLASGTSTLNNIMDIKASAYFAAYNNGKITILYREYQSGYNAIRFRAFYFDGNSITETNNLDIDTSDLSSKQVLDPSIYTVAGSSTYKAYIAWRVYKSTSPPTSTIYYTTVDAGTRGNTYIIKTSSNDLKSPSIVVSPNGIIHISWTENMGNQFGDDILYAYSTDNITFSKPKRVNLDLTNQPQDYSKLSLNNTHGPFIVWNDKRRGKSDVYFEDLRAAKGYSLETVFNVGSTAIPQYVVNDVVNCTDANGNYYIVMGGVGKYTVIKYPTSDSPTVTTQDLETGGVINAMTVRPKTTTIVAVGKVGSNGAVWTIEASTCGKSRITESWATESGVEFLSVEWGYDVSSSQEEASFAIGYYYYSSMYIGLVSSGFTSTSYTSYGGTKPVFTHDGHDYIVFYDDNYDVYGYIAKYNDGSSILSSWFTLISNMGNDGTWIINDASTIRNGVGGNPTIYLACTSGSTWKSVYRVIRTDQTTAYVENVPLDGDFDSQYFKMKSVSIAASSEWALFVGENTYYNPSKGVFVVLSRLSESSNNIISTDAFLTTDKNAFTACQILDSSKVEDKFALIAGLTSSPGVYYLNGDAYDEANINLNAENVLPYVEVQSGSARVYITMPGESIPSTNRIGQELIPSGTNKYEFWVYIVDPNGVSDISSVKFQAFYDNDESGASSWPSSNDRNAKIEITYTHSNGLFELTYPLNTPPVTEVVFDKDDCIATVDPDGDEGSLPEPVTLRLKFVFAPHQQSRHARGGDTSGYDSGTWNFQFVCEDNSDEVTCTASNNGKGESSTPAWEFGYQRRTGLAGVAQRTVIGSGPGGSIGPGTEGQTEYFQLSWSSNGPYKISIEMKDKLTHTTIPTNTIDYSNTFVFQGIDYTDYGDVYTDVYKPNEFPGGKIAFSGAFVKIYWYDNSGGYKDAPPIGTEQVFKTKFSVYVPYGTKAGQYTATMQYVLDIY